MTAAFCLCMPYGIGTYRFEVLDAKSRDLGAVPPMTKLRNNHRAWNMSAALCAFAGLVVIVTNKIRQNHSPLVLSAHGWMGVLALLGIIVRAVVGILKMKELTATGNKTMSWHGSPPPEPSQLHAVSRAERCVCLPYLQPLTRQPAAQGCWYGRVHYRGGCDGVGSCSLLALYGGGAGTRHHTPSRGSKPVPTRMLPADCPRACTLPDRT